MSSVGISDGDTITVVDSEKRQHKVRLNGIDAPEKLKRSGSDRARALHKWRTERMPS